MVFRTKSPSHTGSCQFVVVFGCLSVKCALFFNFTCFALIFASKTDDRLTMATTKPITHQRISKIHTVQSQQSKIGEYYLAFENRH